MSHQDDPVLKPPAARVIEAIGAEKWAILPEALEQIVAIAQRVNDAPEALAAKLGRPLDNTREVTVRDGVAVLPVIGPIFRYANIFTEISGATSVDVLATDFRTALDNPGVSSVILEIDSPGGMIAGISEFAQMVRAADKPVVAYVSAMGASAAYWIASAADQVVVQDTAEVGSIGVVATVRTDKRKGVMEIVSTQSPSKRPDPNEPVGRAELQAEIDALAQVFVEAVAANRGVELQTVLNNFGRGGLLVGAQAVQAGMADSVGALESLIVGTEADMGTNTITTESISKDHPAVADALRAEGRETGLLAAAEALESIANGTVPDGHALLVEVADRVKLLGADVERARIFAVEEQALPGHEALIAGFKRDGKTTGAEAAVAVLKAEKDKHSDGLAGLRADGQLNVKPAALPTGDAVDPNLPVEDRCKAEWEKSPDVRAEFPDLKTYIAFTRATEDGRVRILRR